MAHQYIYVMKDLKKIVPPKREILKGIWLSFYPGAKIGVIGGNGAGKSTLLRIMAGVDKEFLGEAWPADGVRVGYLPQEPQLDPTKDVRGNVEDGVGEVRALLTRFDEINARLGEPLDDAGDGKAAGRAGPGAGRDRGGQRLGSRPHCRDRDGRAALSAGRRGRGHAVGRRGAPRRALPPPPPEARSAAARRAHQPPRRGVGRLARALSQGLPGHGGGHHPRPLLPRQRRGLDPRARPRRGHPVGGQLLLLARAEEAAPGPRGEAGDRAAAHARARARVGAHVAARAPGQVQVAPAGLRGAARGGRARSRGTGRDHHPARPRAWATSWCRPSTCSRATATGC